MTFVFFLVSLVQQGGEIQEALKLKKGNIYVETEEEEGNTYQNHVREKSKSNTVQWIADSSTA